MCDADEIKGDTFQFFLLFLSFRFSPTFTPKSGESDLPTCTDLTMFGGDLKSAFSLSSYALLLVGRFNESMSFYVLHLLPNAKHV